MTNPEASLHPTPFQDHRNREQRVLGWIHGAVEQGALDKPVNTYREVELEPTEVERRVRIVREYLALYLETTKPMTEDEYYQQKRSAVEVHDTLTPALRDIIAQARKWGLTQSEIYHLSDDPRWQLVAFKIDDIPDKVIGSK